MKNKKIKILLIAISSLVVAAISTGLYLYNMPHRDIQNQASDIAIDAFDLVTEYLADPIAGNDKYLQEEGDSKILTVSGKVIAKSKDMNGQQVVTLEGIPGKSSVSCTFTSETNKSAIGLAIGNLTSIKGVIRAGAAYDEDLEMYEDVILEKCDIIE